MGVSLALALLSPSVCHTAKEMEAGGGALCPALGNQMPTLIWGLERKMQRIPGCRPQKSLQEAEQYWTADSKGSTEARPQVCTME